ncbi:MAG: hypothetical protein PVG71_05300, partial [Anaerolineae bacterium]
MLKRASWILISVLVVMGMLLVACAPQPTPAPTEKPAEPTEPPAEEPTEVPEEEPEVGIDCMGAAEGDEVTLLYQWSGVEEEKLNEILQPLVEACGIKLVPESTRDHALLDTRVEAGTPP